ncbi:MAG: DUF2946 family protein [Planctomycetaceae bacterium]
MRRRYLHALVLATFLARLVLPAFHFHDEEGHGGTCHHHEHAAEGSVAEAGQAGPAAQAAHEDCAICKLLALHVPGVEPGHPQRVEPLQAAEGERAHLRLATPQPALLWFGLLPRGPPSFSPA